MLDFFVGEIRRNSLFVRIAVAALHPVLLNLPGRLRGLPIFQLRKSPGRGVFRHCLTPSGFVRARGQVRLVCDCGWVTDCANRINIPRRNARPGYV